MTEQASGPTRVVGLLHPGLMGSTIGGCIAANGHEVRVVLDGRSAQSQQRAVDAGFHDAGSVPALVSQVDVVVSVCPPEFSLDVAVDVARAGFDGVYLDANAIAPATARAIAEVLTDGGARYVDGGIVGPANLARGETLIYLSGAAAGEVVPLLEGPQLGCRVIGDGAAQASALKASHAALSKGMMSLLLLCLAAADQEDVLDDLVGYWEDKLPDYTALYQRVLRFVPPNAWRCVSEMDEAARLFEDAALPSAFPYAAREVYERLRGFKGRSASLDEMIEALLVDDGSAP